MDVQVNFSDVSVRQPAVTLSRKHSDFLRKVLARAQMLEFWRRFQSGILPQYGCEPPTGDSATAIFGASRRYGYFDFTLYVLTTFFAVFRKFLRGAESEKPAFADQVQI